MKKRQAAHALRFVVQLVHRRLPQLFPSRGGSVFWEVTECGPPSTGRGSRQPDRSYWLESSAAESAIVYVSWRRSCVMVSGRQYRVGWATSVGGKREGRITVCGRCQRAALGW